MKEKMQNKYVMWGITLFSVLAALLLLFFAIYRIEKIVGVIIKILNILMPIICGLVIAYIMNPVVKWLENNVFDRLLPIIFKEKLKDKKKLSRGLSLFTSTIIFWGIIITCISFLLPEILKSLQLLVGNLNTYLNNGKIFLLNFFGENEEIKSYINNNFSKISDFLASWLDQDKIDGFVTALSTGIFGTLKFLYNAVIGYIISIYILFDKEKFIAQTKKLLYTIFDSNKINLIMENARYTDKVFGGFFSGKLIDSLIVGIICYFAMVIFRWPYALIIALIVGVTNIIPYFGPFIGAIPSAFLIFLVNPSTCIEFLIFVFILQQIDGNIIGPKILGGKTGLSSFWVLCSLLIFGGLFGVVGMIIGVPIFSIIYSVINGTIKKRLSDKNLPINSDDYEKLMYIDEKTGNPVYDE